MHNKKLYIYNLLTYLFIFCLIVLISISTLLYIKHLNLFNNINIIISGNNFVTKNQILDEIDPYLNKSLLDINLEELTTSIRSLKYIKHIQVSRILPNNLCIQIIEKKPIVLITLNEKKMFMDSEGLLIPNYQNAISFYPVPVITINRNISSIEELSKEISIIFDFIMLDFPFFYNNLSEIFIKSDEWVFFSDDKTYIYANSNKLLKQLNVLKNFQKTVYPIKNLDDYKYIDLRYTDQIIVREKNRKI